MSEACGPTDGGREGVVGMSTGVHLPDFEPFGGEAVTSSWKDLLAASGPVQWTGRLYVGPSLCAPRGHSMPPLEEGANGGRHMITGRSATGRTA